VDKMIVGVDLGLDLAEPQIRKRAISTATNRLKILRSSLGTNAGCIGAAVLLALCSWTKCNDFGPRYQELNYG